MAQFAQPQPHEVLPLRLFFIVDLMIATTIAIRMAATIIVPMFELIHVSIGGCSLLFRKCYSFIFTSFVSVVDSLYGRKSI